MPVWVCGTCGPHGRGRKSCNHSSYIIALYYMKSFFFMAIILIKVWFGFIFDETLISQHDIIAEGPEN